MYKVIIKNNFTGVRFEEYGFTRWMMKRVYFLMNEQDENPPYKKEYEIEWLLKVSFSWKTFKKCLTNYSKVV